MKKTYIIVDGQCVEKQEYYAQSNAPMVIPDIQPYQSMIDGSMIQSRSRHREHLRDNNCIEVGNEKMETKVAPPSSEKRREILRAQLSNMTDTQANKILQHMRDNPRMFNPHRR